VNQLPKDFSQAIIKLVNSARTQDPKSINLATRRLASKAKSIDSELSKSLSLLVLDESALRSSSSRPNPSPVDADSRQKLLIEEYDIESAESPYLASETQFLFDDFFNEWRNRDKLEQEGLSPSRSIILTGPPGCGKTTSAAWVANELELPLFTLDLATVMSSYLGKTGSNIKAVLDYAQSVPCVLLLDEFDSIAKRRDDDTELGELKRLVNVLLQAIESWPSSSVLMAATNHGDLLDPAVWRRFDLRIDFPIPTSGQISSYLNSQIEDYCLAKWISSRITPGSMADLKNDLFRVRKKAILQEDNFLESLLLTYDIEIDPKSVTDVARSEAILELVTAGFSQRKISETTGLSRPLVKSISEKSITTQGSEHG